MGELEHYAVDQAEETTDSVNNCLKIAEGIREDAGKTLDTLHAQGEQIHRTHEKAAEMEKDLSKGEKILGNLGGMFSMTWKPKKGKEITRLRRPIRLINMLMVNQRIPCRKLSWRRKSKT